MIIIGHRQYGTAAELVNELGLPDVTERHIYDWADRGLIDRWHRPGRGRGTTWSRLDQVAAVEAQTASSARGRKRSLDSEALAA